MYSDDEERFKALCEQAFNEEDLEKAKQHVSEILAILEANENYGPNRPDDKAS